MAMAAPAAASAGRAAAGKAAGQKTAQASAGKAAGAPGKGDWAQRAADLGGGAKKSKGSGSAGKFLKGGGGNHRKWILAEFLICAMLLGLSPLAKKSGEMGPARFMKRGSATCAMFVILGLLSAGGKGAARAAAMFGALVTVVLLVDQREAFGKLAKTLTVTDEDEAADAASAAGAEGPSDDTDAPPLTAEA